MRRFAIADIHGCAQTFEALLSSINFSKKDELYLLGDYINKGPRSKEVLDAIIKLKEQNYSVQCVLGNHDVKLLDVIKGNIAGSWLSDSQLIITLESFGVDSPFKIDEKYLKLLSGFSYYIELDNFILVHAGFNFQIKNVFIDQAAMINAKFFHPDKSKVRGKKIIHGHIPTKVGVVEDLVKQKSDVIKIDAGCVYYESEGYGNLVALNLDSYELCIQANIDKPYKGGRYR